MRGRLRLGSAALALALVLSAARAEAPAAVAGARPTVTLELQPGEVKVGDLLSARIVVTAPDPLRLAPAAIGGSLGPFTVAGGSWSGPETQAGVSRWIWSGSLMAFRTGDLEVPPVQVALRAADGSTTTAESLPVQVSVGSVLPAPADPAQPEEIADLKPAASVAPSYRNLIWALALLGLVLALALIFSWLHRRYAARLAAVPVPEDPFHRTPPHVWVYAELQRLLDRRLAEQGQIDLFFAELARIMKLYLGGRYRVELMERTTDEVPAALGQAGAPAAAVEGVAALLSGCDLVKFAAVRPTVAECREGVEQAYRLVDGTKPAEAQLAPAERGAA